MKSKKNDPDMGYMESGIYGSSSEWTGKDCHDLDIGDGVADRQSPKLKCAIAKYIYPCSKLPCAHGKIGFSSKDKERQRYYRDIITDYCKKSPTACSDTGADGFKKVIDPICFETNVCSVKNRISDIPKVAMETFEFFDKLVSFNLGKKTFKRIRDRRARLTRNKERRKEAKTAYQNIEKAFKTQIMEGKNCKSKSKSKKKSKESNNSENNENSNSNDSSCPPNKTEGFKMCSKYKDDWCCAYKKYKYLLMLREALKYTRTGFMVSNESQAIADDYLKSQINSIERCLNNIGTITVNLEEGLETQNNSSKIRLKGIKIFEEYHKHKTDYKNRSSGSKISKSLRAMTTKKAKIVDIALLAQSEAKKQTTFLGKMYRRKTGKNQYKTYNSKLNINGGGKRRYKKTKKNRKKLTRKK